MARTVRDSKLETRKARSELKAQGKPYYRLIDPGFHLGYRRLSGGAGKWVVRHYAGAQTYIVQTIATADDISDSNSADVLDFAEAQEKAREWRDQRSQAAAGITGPYTVNKALDDYLDYLRSEGRADSAVKDAAYRINAFIRPTLGKFEVAALKPEQLRHWRADLAKAAPRLRTNPKETQQRRKTKDERARKATANRILSTLKAALNHAFDEEKVSSNKAWGRRVKPFENVNASRPGHLTVAEAKRVINAADFESGFRDLVRAALETGCRYGELCALRVRDFHHRMIAIHRSKTGKPRDVVLTDEGIAFFEQLTAGRAKDEIMLRNLGRVGRALERERERQRKDGKPDKGAKIADDGAWQKSEQARPMAEACEHAKISPAIGFHQLRHTWASLSVMAGVPLLLVARNLGHLSRDGQPHTRMVERHYAHLVPSFAADAIRKGAPKFGMVKPTNVAALR